MKDLKEFLEKLNSDAGFAEEVNAACQAKKEAGAEKVEDALMSVAKDLGYEFSAEELKGSMKESLSELSEEEMGKVSGGTLDPVTLIAGTACFVTTVIMSIEWATSDPETRGGHLGKNNGRKTEKSNG